MTLAGPFSSRKRMNFSAKTLKAGLRRSGGKCEKCGTPFSDANPPEGDHILEAAEGGDNSLENLQMLGAKCCHRDKTNAYVSRIRKADRQSREGHWLKRAKAKTKKKIPSRPFNRKPVKQINDDFDRTPDT